MRIADHGLWIVDRIDVTGLDNGHGASVVVHGRKLDADTRRWRDNQSMTFECASHVEVHRVMADLLTHTDWWGIA